MVQGWRVHRQLMLFGAIKTCSNHRAHTPIAELFATIEVIHISWNVYYKSNYYLHKNVCKWMSHTTSDCMCATHLRWMPNTSVSTCVIFTIFVFRWNWWKQKQPSEKCHQKIPKRIPNAWLALPIDMHSASRSLLMAFLWPKQCHKTTCSTETILFSMNLVHCKCPTLLNFHSFGFLTGIHIDFILLITYLFNYNPNST